MVDFIGIYELLINNLVKHLTIYWPSDFYTCIQALGKVFLSMCLCGAHLCLGGDLCGIHPSFFLWAERDCLSFTDSEIKRWLSCHCDSTWFVPKKKVTYTDPRMDSCGIRKIMPFYTITDPPRVTLAIQTILPQSGPPSSHQVRVFFCYLPTSTFSLEMVGGGWTGGYLLAKLVSYH